MLLLESLRAFMLTAEYMVPKIVPKIAPKIAQKQVSKAAAGFVKSSAHSIAATRHAGKKYMVAQNAVASQNTQSIFNVFSKSKVEYKEEMFTPAETDSLFWCFYISCYGFAEYELNRTNRFLSEKQCKLSALEKLCFIKAKLSNHNVDIGTVRTELIGGKPTISFAGLTALCYAHDTAITYVVGNEYCVLNAACSSPKLRCNIITKNPTNNVHSLQYKDEHTWQLFQDNLKTNFLERTAFSETAALNHVTKKLNTMKVSELREMCTVLRIPLLDERGRAFTKQRLCDELHAYKAS